MSNVWMVRAGGDGYLIGNFLANEVIAVGWNEVGDLSNIADLDGIKAKYREAHPEDSTSTVSNQAGMIHRFRTKIAIDDDIVTYSPDTREYSVGKVVSDYFYDDSLIHEYPHLRKIKWSANKVSRDQLSQSSRYSLGAVLALFNINEDVWGEFQTILNGQVVETTKDEVRLEIEIKDYTKSNSIEAIKDKIMQIKPSEMEEFVAAVLRAMGYKTRVTQKTGDRGVDIIASTDGLGFHAPRIKVEVKKQNSQVTSENIRSFTGGLRSGDNGLYVSTGGFTKDAKYEAERAQFPCTLIDLDGLAGLVIDNYEGFDVEGRTMLPLVKMYWPAE